MNNALTLEPLEIRTLLTGPEGDDCILDGQDFPGCGDDGGDFDEGNCYWQIEDGDIEGVDPEQGFFNGIEYALERLGVSLISSGLGVIEGAVVALPSIALIVGGEYLLGKVPAPAPLSMSAPVKILLGLATYPLSLQVMDELLTQEAPSDPLLRVLSPVKSLVEGSDSVIKYFEEVPSLEVESWAKALQPRALKNFYWAAATTVFSGASGGFDYPHLELPERAEHNECYCEC